MEMIVATIMDERFVPISGDFEIFDGDFSEVEIIAKRGGETCCIMWQRESDGQVAYYGPRGCTLRPYFYKPEQGDMK